MRYLMLLASVLVVLILFSGCSEEDPVMPEIRRGTINIAPEPDGISPRWTLTGPDKFQMTGTGNMRLENLEPGDYTMVWGIARGWAPPDGSSVTKTLEPGGTLVFSRLYTALPPEHSITITTEPEGINAPWQLSGPDGFRRSGSGHLVLRDMPIGSYTLVWGDLTGYNTPNPVTLTLSLPANGALVFLGNYKPKAGTITINALPRRVDSCWILAGPAGILEGTGNTVLTDMGSGDYTLTWCHVPGWNVPEPATVTQALHVGGSLIFTGEYTSRLGTITINPQPAFIDPCWMLTGPGIALEGSGYSVITDMEPGDYVLAWCNVEFEGWTTPSPNPVSMMLQENGTLTFTGVYAGPVGSIEIDPRPETVLAPWELTGPGGFVLSGQGNEVLENRVLGEYTLTWGDIDGYSTPIQNHGTLSVAGETIVFTGEYEVQPGTIIVQPEPTSIDAPWMLAGHEEFCHEGNGYTVLTDLAPGDYTLTWRDVEGWTRPNPATETKTLVDILTFTGAYSVHFGTIVIEPKPTSIGAPWLLTGPGGFCRHGEGNSVLTDMYPGTYTLTWLEIGCWTTPSPATVNQTLQAGQSLVFSCIYTGHPGEITIQPEPEATNAPWILTGPGFNLHGIGREVLSNMVSGTYSITWGDVPDWATPASEMQTLDLCGEVTFIGVYHYVGNSLFVTYIPPGEFKMGSAEYWGIDCEEWQVLNPRHPSCFEPGRYNNETQHKVILSRGFYMSKHEVTEALWDDIMGSGTSTSQRPKGGVSWDKAIEFCNALSIREGLAPAYTIHSSNGHVTWNRNANGFRLPTEAEWEYACRAGTVLAYNNDTDCLSSDTEANFRGNSGQLPGCPLGAHRGASTDVGSFQQPNAWGLFDMHGNVREWVWDAYESHFPIQTRDPVRDGAPGVSRVIRGGHWNSEARQCRSAFREPLPPSDNQLYNGLRPVRTAF